jgi:hypothetical protein
VEALQFIFFFVIFLFCLESTIHSFLSFAVEAT